MIASTAGKGMPSNQPRPIWMNQPSVAIGMEKPWVMTSAAPRRIESPASVTMKDGIPS